MDLGVKPGNWPADFPEPHPTAHLTGAGRQMSPSSLMALIRRAVAWPMGLVDRADATLDACFARADVSLDRLTGKVRLRAGSISQDLSHSADSFDRALDRRVRKLDSQTTKRAAGTRAVANHIGSVVANLESRTDTKLNRSLHAVDRTSDAAARVAIATMTFSIAMIDRADHEITRGFNRLDARANSGISRGYRQQAVIRSLAHNMIDRVDQRIEANVLRSDARVGKRIDQLTKATIATANLFSANALVIERAMDFGITRVDAQIAAGKASGVAATLALSKSLTKVDKQLTGSLTRIDESFESCTTGFKYRSAQISELAAESIVSTEAKIDNTLVAFDHRVSGGVQGLSTTALEVSKFSIDRISVTDRALTRQVSRIDAHTESLTVRFNGHSKDQASHGRTSLHRMATALTLVLGTLGAATGASVSSASPDLAEVDVTLKYESNAAKDAVTQYLSIRDSFQALQASRSRSIKTLKKEIASAKARASQASLDGDAIIDIANNYNGAPYVRGGTTPSGFDCSGYTSYVFAQLGVDLPRTSYEQKAWADSVSVKDRKVGDLMFWQGGGIDHVAIYAGDGKMWDSPRPGRRVGKISIWGNPTYGRVPTSAINGPALREIETKSAELKKLIENEPQLPITIDERNLIQVQEPKAPATANN